MATTLPALPSIGRSLLSGVTRLRRPSPDDGLAEDAVRVEGVTQDVARLAAYDRLCGFPLRDAVPSTWLHVLTFPLQMHLMAASGFPFSAPGTVHLSNEMTQHRPVRVGEVLDLEVAQGNLRPHRKGAAFDLISSVSVAGEEVWRGVSSYLATHGRVAGEPEEIEKLAMPEASMSQLWRLPASLGMDYARVSGDVNPIHLHPLTGKAFGMKSNIVHGMWTHARALAALGGVLPAAYTARVQFTKPVTLPRKVGFAVERGDGGAARFAVVKPADAAPYLVGELEAAAAD